MQDQILLLLSPILVNIVASSVKKIKPIKFSGYKKSILRFIVAALSFLAVIAGSMYTGVDIDIMSIETFVDVLLKFLEATGIYFFMKVKK